MASVAIIGAGMAGVSAGLALVQDGFNVTVFDRGRRPGGRCSSKRHPLPFDHGARYVTASDPRFAKILQRLAASGDVARWDARVLPVQSERGGSPDEVMRFVGIPGMSRVVEALAAPLHVSVHTQIAAARESARGWSLVDDVGSALGEYDALLVAMPPEQARALIPRHSPLLQAFAGVRSTCCWAALLAFESRLPLDFDIAEFDRRDVVWAARDSGKPSRDPGERWVVHAASAWSRDRFRAEPEVVADEMAQAFFDAVALEPRPLVSLTGHRWGFARVDRGPGPGALWDDDIRLGVCGDWCVAPNLEGAWLSGLEAAAMLTRSVGRLRRRRPATNPGNTAPAL